MCSLFILDHWFCPTHAALRVRLAVCRETGECVAVKIMTVDGKEGLSHESLRKEVSLFAQCYC